MNYSNAMGRLVQRVGRGCFCCCHGLSPGPGLSLLLAWSLSVRLWLLPDTGNVGVCAQPGVNMRIGASLPVCGCVDVSWPWIENRWELSLPFVYPRAFRLRLACCRGTEVGEDLGCCINLAEGKMNPAVFMTPSASSE